MKSIEKNNKNKILSPLILFGLAFFILPNFEIFDFMPDLIGFILLYFSLERIAEFDSRTEQARKLMLWFSLISGVRIIVALTSLSFSDSSDTMTVITIFAICEGILFFILANNFFEGLSYTLTRNESGNAIKTVSDAKFITMFFGFTKIGLNLIPSLFAILEVDKYQTQNLQYFQELEQIQNLAMLLCITISLIFGIYWFSVILKFYNTLRKDDEFIRFVSERYENEIAKNTKYLAKKHYMVAKITGLLSIIFLFTVQIDGQLLMPEFISGALVVFTAIILIQAYKKYSIHPLIGANKNIWIAAIVLTAIQVAAYFYRLTLTMEIYVKMSWQETLLLALFSAATGLLLAYIWLNLQIGFRQAEEELYNVNLKNRYEWQKYTAIGFILLRTITLAAPPARKYLGGFEIVFLIAWIVTYMWYLNKTNNE
ncbi:MAG: hypothetical protein A2Y17_06300 [Clostridiales bacterium GWF2_38_85]|nr:MAG: hypothetical protein A2Y17_06300 [Clostridiales bacterium GWF2_38_85]HBL85504.1 hypothetical protein [Clostridiales bacterium]